MTNLKAEATTEWADGTYTFRLPVDQVLELEAKCDAPITVIGYRLDSGTYSLKDVRETIRLGLIGGGKTPVEAVKLVKQYVDARPIAESWPIARVVVGAALYGFSEAPLGEGDDEGKPQAAPTEDSQSASTPPPSTPMPHSYRPSRLRALVESRFGNTQQP